MYLIYSIYAKKEENKIQIGRKHQFKVKANMGSQKKKKNYTSGSQKSIFPQINNTQYFFFLMSKQKYAQSK